MTIHGERFRVYRLLPAAIGLEQCICGDDKHSHDGGDGDLGGFSRGDEGWHVECLTRVGAATVNEALALPA